MEELVALRGQNSKTYDLGNGKRRLITGGGIHHYKDDPDDSGELWKDVDPIIVESPKANWDWEVVKGNWHLLIREDTTVAFGKAGHWIGFRYGGFGYLDWATKQYQSLQTRQAVTPVLENNAIRWNGIFGAGTSLEYVYTPNGFKENIYVEQSARNWLANNPPSSFGLSNSSSYLMGYLECDWSGSYPAEQGDGTPINWDNVTEFIDGGVYWRHPILNSIVTALPLGWAQHNDIADPTAWAKLRYRFYKHTDGKCYLLFGAKVLALNAYPEGTIILDPTLTVQPNSIDRNPMSDVPNDSHKITMLQGNRTAAKRRFILKFDISALPANAGVTSAVMSIYYAGYYATAPFIDPKGKAITAYRCTRYDWTEVATWNRYKSLTNWTTAGGDYSTTDSPDTKTTTTIPTSVGWMAFSDSKNIVNDAIANRSDEVNYLVRADVEIDPDICWYAYCRARDHADYPPKLVIEYSVTRGASAFFPFM